MKFHSKVDVIMNSSATVYSWVSSDAETQALNGLQQIMDMMGIDGKADDYFEVLINYNTDYILDNFVDQSDEWDKYIEALGIDHTEARKNEKIIEDFIVFIEELIKDDAISLSINNNDYGDNKTVLIKSKVNDQEFDIGSMLWSLFAIEVGYD